MAKGLKNMNNCGAVGTISTLAIVSFIIMGTGASALILNKTQDFSIDAKKIVNDIITEVTTYLKVEDAIGKCYANNGSYKVKQIALLLKPLTPITLDITTLTIELQSNNDVFFLKYGGQVTSVKKQALFKIPVWNHTKEGMFNLAVLHDSDDSIANQAVLNNDMVFLLIDLPDYLSMKKNDVMQVKLFFPNGMMRTIDLKTPSLLGNKVVTLR